jgi:trehalose 6-phosphate synthase
MSRLVVVSNRVPSTSPAKLEAGGLAVALQAALNETGGLWFGWSGKVVEPPAPATTVTQCDRFTLATLDLARPDYEGYYNGFANRTLWPLLHSRLDLTSFNAAFFQSYQQVNALFAARLTPLLTPDDAVWVHDYHLIPLGEELRRAGLDNPLGFYLHIPFPSPEVMMALPWHRELAKALCAYDLIGFQTRRDLQNFRDFMQREMHGAIDGDGNLQVFGRTLVANAFPIGIDADKFAAMAGNAEPQEPRPPEHARRHRQIIGVDRLDYTKGLVERFRAFEALMETHPEYHGRVCLTQVAAPSREHVPEYLGIRTELEQIAGGINGRFAELDWTPIHYINRSFGQKQLAGLYRNSEIGLVTPLRDGMNLVAKEYVASQDPENPGILVLSQFAGAAEQLLGALIVNPYDIQSVAKVLHTALAMPVAERRARWRPMMASLCREDIGHWRDGFLRALFAARQPRRIYHLVPERRVVGQSDIARPEIARPDIGQSDNRIGVISELRKAR